MLTFPNGRPATVPLALLLIDAGQPVRVVGTETEVRAFCAEVQTARDARRAHDDFADVQRPATPAPGPIHDPWGLSRLG